MNENLVYDVGLHKGEDTDFYLRKGYSVIGIEANPKLIASATTCFQDAIARGRLHLIEGAVAPDRRAIRSSSMQIRAIRFGAQLRRNGH